MSIQQMFLGAGGESGTPVEEVFDIKLYLGNDSTNTINNGMNLDVQNGSPGGMVLHKIRDYDGGHFVVYDTTRGPSVDVHFNLINPSDDRSGGGTANYGLTSFNTNGFTHGANWMWENGNGYNHVAWTFMKSEKFFDIVTWSGDVYTDQTLDHNLGCEPGMIIAKNLTDSAAWKIYHNAITDAEYRILETNSREPATPAAWALGISYWSPTSTDFKAAASIGLNTNNKDYIAYLFAADESNIKCGKYTGSGSSGNSVTVGFKPQFLLIKRAVGGTGDWIFLDTTRGINSSGNDAVLECPTVGDEDSSGDYVSLTNNGFDVETTSEDYNKSGDVYIYMAIKEE